jgi:hypothetical protein
VLFETSPANALPADSTKQQNNKIKIFIGSSCQKSLQIGSGPIGLGRSDR